ncbi:hypothetical protein ACLIIZ_03100 [Azonexus caeni]|uniref:hypothetical protein n=1 Tax=Azonexus caeni TaxID=266126 RepID=UPI003A8B10B6
MPYVIALQSFDHGQRRSKGARFYASDREAEKMRRKGLVMIDASLLQESRPTKPAGVPSSASQAGQALPQTMLPESKPGAKRGRKKTVAA